MNIDCEQHHASLAVSDVAAAVEFYTKKLGFGSRSPRAIRRPLRA